MKIQNHLVIENTVTYGHKLLLCEKGTYRQRTLANNSCKDQDQQYKITLKIEGWKLEIRSQLPLKRNAESSIGTWNPESTIWILQSKTVLDSYLTWGEKT